VNLVGRVLEVHRAPARDTSSRFGWRYSSVEVFPPDAIVSPLARLQARIPVADLLP
jgi:hypothetical protein